MLFVWKSSTRRSTKFGASPKICMQWKVRSCFIIYKVYKRAKTHRTLMDLCLRTYKQTLLNTIGMPLFLLIWKFLLQWDPFVEGVCTIWWIDFPRWQWVNRCLKNNKLAGYRARSKTMRERKERIFIICFFFLIHL